jgi:hypothetical protein
MELVSELQCLRYLITSGRGDMKIKIKYLNKINGILREISAYFIRNNNNNNNNNNTFTAK